VRLVIDTSLLISALLAGSSLPAHLIALWREGQFDLLTSADQLDELMRVTRYPRIRERLAPRWPVGSSTNSATPPLW
jgi:putative PIN family toxin of toxin-antitoxin system